MLQSECKPRSPRSPRSRQLLYRVLSIFSFDTSSEAVAKKVLKLLLRTCAATYRLFTEE